MIGTKAVFSMIPCRRKHGVGWFRTLSLGAYQVLMEDLELNELFGAALERASDHNGVRSPVKY